MLPQMEAPGGERRKWENRGAWHRVGQVWGGVSPPQPTMGGVVCSPAALFEVEPPPETHFGVFQGHKTFL